MCLKTVSVPARNCYQKFLSVFLCFFIILTFVFKAERKVIWVYMDFYREISTIPLFHCSKCIHSFKPPLFSNGKPYFPPKLFGFPVCAFHQSSDWSRSAFLCCIGNALIFPGNKLIKEWKTLANFTYSSTMKNGNIFHLELTQNCGTNNFNVSCN